MFEVRRGPMSQAAVPKWPQAIGIVVRSKRC
jgi:hypothetical protein